MANPAVFAVFFTGKSFPISSASWVQADATHWVRWGEHYSIT
jgi:hypothetical protein